MKAKMVRNVLKILFCGWFALAVAWLSAAQTESVERSGATADQEGSKKTAPASKAPASPDKATTPKAPPGITPEREAAVMTFVERHHPELRELLIHLKEYRTKEYERAVRELLRTSERLAQIQERDSSLYELELRLWKARSRAQLLAARLQMAPSDDLREQLRAALGEEHDVRLQILRRDHERMQERVNNLADQIERLERHRSEDIDKQMKQLTAALRGGESKGKTEARTKSPAKLKTTTKQETDSK